MSEIKNKPQHQHYDPRVSEEDLSKKGGAVVWSTQSVNWAKESIEMGAPLKKTSPFYENKNVDIRKGKIPFQYSDEEIKEIVRCSRDIVYFIQTYCKVKRPDGKMGEIKLRPYQLIQIRDYLENDRVILGWSRQAGKTIGSALFIIWAMLFNADKQTAILANKGATSKEVLDKIKDIYKGLPFFLQAGVVGWNDTRITFDNGCSIYRGPTTEDALNGKTCNILYMDEFAFVGKGADKIRTQKSVLSNAMPVLSSQKHSGLCKLIITSTPNGKDYYYELFDNALKEQNSYKASKICWWSIPGRNQAWAKEEIGTIGLAEFRQQYEMSFDTTTKTLLKTETLRRLSISKEEYSNELYEVLSVYNEKLYMNPLVDIDFENDVFLLSVDIAEGLRQDYSVCQIIRLNFDEEAYKFYYEQVGYFKANDISIDEFADVVAELFNAFNPEYSKLLVEQNTYGDYFFKVLQFNEDYEIDLASICKFKRSSDSEYVTKGLRQNSERKKISVKAFKSLVDANAMVVTSSDTIEEIENFQENQKGNYEASIGHDDTVMPLVNLSYFIQLNEVEFKNWIEDFCDLNEIIVDPNEAVLASKTKSYEDVREDLTEESLSPEARALLNSV
ncbi:terminase large subunit [Tenacibaculum phage PTm1]|uniref:Terminase large subunit n=2 Tax=Shirahamavirus PTm1 TaxID=2846435 RepID=A0A5S9HX45_9CAUD|nr:terminase large subunit [Tenacibaculum phage PTm1]BBI90405.1 terminase large subunit [Tenacibaculum phage PTm1]BBI90714.1 terminase large subunit [Tenacibaculum phage PTm5]